MTREQAIAIAKAAAAERWTDHEYITDPYDARWADWMPHEWVIDAVMAATPAPEVPPENLPTKEHIRELAQEALDQIMEQAQVFASAWSLVGGRFDYGNALSEAHDAKDELRSMVRSLADLAAETVRPAPCAAVVDGKPFTYSSTQATNCASCGKHKHTPLRIDAMGGYVCLTCIDKKLGGLLGEFGCEDDPQRKDAERYRWLRDKADYLRVAEGSPQVCMTDEWGELVSLGRDAYPQGEKLDAALDAAMAFDVPVQKTGGE